MVRIRTWLTIGVVTVTAVVTSAVVTSVAGVSGTAGTASAAARPAAAPRVAVHPAAVGCHGSACDGKMAAEEGCRADALQVGGKSLTDPVRYYTLWYSPACHSAWAEFDSTSAATDNVEILQWIDEYGGSNGSYQVVLGDAGNYPTPMVTWDDSVRVCMNTNTVPVSACTRWR